jgi:hypothetical protein
LRVPAYFADGIRQWRTDVGREMSMCCSELDAYICKRYGSRHMRFEMSIGLDASTKKLPRGCKTRPQDFDTLKALQRIVMASRTYGHAIADEDLESVNESS